MKLRSDIAHEELTRHPIFLVQERVVIPTVGCEAEYSADASMYVHEATGELISDDRLIKLDWAVAAWRTVSVTSTREEGGEVGKEMFPCCEGYRNGKDWMVYCIHCVGSLAEMLRKQEEV